MKILSDKKILDSWKKNASSWIKAIQDNEIESRRLVTDQAIIETISSLPVKKALDIGCGEGWLVRRLSTLGISATGIDAIETLVSKAKDLGGGSFKTLEYTDISVSTINETYDIAICNFSLLGEESVDHIFKSILSLINVGGHFVIQTPHPITSCGDQPYVDGWREGSWIGFSDDFSDPAPWYFRTKESWIELFNTHGLIINEVKEPIHPKTGKPTSLILVGSHAT